MGLYRERGDERGSIKLLVSHSHAPVHEPSPLPEPSQSSPTIHTITPPVLPQHSYPPLRPRRRSRSRRGSMSSASERLPPDQSAGYEASVSDDLDHVEPRRPIRALPQQPSAPRQPLPQPPRPKSPPTYSRPLSPGGTMSPDRVRLQQEVPGLRPDWPRGTPPSTSPDIGRSQEGYQLPRTNHGRSGSDAALDRERATQLIDFGPESSPSRRVREPEDSQRDKPRRKDMLRKETALQRTKATHYDVVGSEIRRRDDGWTMVPSNVHSSGYKKERPTTPQESRPSPSRNPGFGPSFPFTMPQRPPPPPPGGEQRERSSKRQAGKAVPASYVISYKGPQKNDPPPIPQSPPPPPFSRLMKSMNDLRVLYQQGSTSQTQSGRPRQAASPLPLKPSGSGNSSNVDPMAASGSNYSENISSSYHDSPLHGMETVKTYDGPRYPALSPSVPQYPTRTGGSSSQSPPLQNGSNYLFATGSGQEPYPRPRSATGNGPTTSPYRSNRTLQSPNNPDFPPETPQHRPSPQGIPYYQGSTNMYRDDCYHGTGTGTGFGPRPIPSHSRHERSNTDNLGIGTFDYSTSRLPRTPPRSPVTGKSTLDPKDSKAPETFQRTLSSTLPVQEDDPSSAESTMRHEDYKHITRMLENAHGGTGSSGSNTVVPSRPPLPYMSSASGVSNTLLNGSLNFSTASSVGHDSVHSDDSDFEGGGTIWAKAPPKSINSSRPVLPPIDTDGSPSSRPAPLPREHSRPPLPGYIPESPPALRRVNRSNALNGRHLKDQRTSRFDNNFDVTWAPRPPPEEVLERLQEYFPEHDVDEPVIDAPSGGTSPTSTTAEPGPLPAAERRSRHKKSIRVVAAERRRIDRSSHVEPAANAGAALRKRNTKLWGSRLEEVPTHEQAHQQQPPTSGDGSPGPGKRKHILQRFRSTSKPFVAIFRWVRGELIGKGTYGKVYLALNATTGEMIAVKQVEIPRTASDKNDSRQVSVVEALKLESETLKDLDHPHIVQYLGFEETPTFLSM